MNRVQPAAGFSLSELDDAGVDLDLAESLGLPVDAGRIGAYGPNVTGTARFRSLLSPAALVDKPALLCLSRRTFLRKLYSLALLI